MERTLKSFVCNIGMCGMFAVITGCAALTIDVDVYKGSLVDDIHVQTESTTVMAMGAKPLLIQLRNTLEEESIELANIDSADHWDYPEGEHDHTDPFTGKSTCLTGRKKILEFQNNPNYGNGFIGENYEFCGEEPFRVNAVLSLYEDRTYSSITDPVQKIKHAIRDYKTFRSILFPVNTANQMETWEDLKSAIKPEFQEEIDQSLIDQSLRIEKLLVLAEKEKEKCESEHLVYCEIDGKPALDTVMIGLTLPKELYHHNDAYKGLRQLKSSLQKKIVTQQLLKDVMTQGNPFKKNNSPDLYNSTAALLLLVDDQLETCQEIKKTGDCQLDENVELVTSMDRLTLPSLWPPGSTNHEALKQLKAQLQKETVSLKALNNFIKEGNPYYKNQFIAKALVTAYEEFLAPRNGSSDINKIFQIHQILKLAASRRKNLQIATWPSIIDLLDSSDFFDKNCKKSKGKKYQKTQNGKDIKYQDCDASATSMFLALAKNKKKIINFHADLLFQQQSNQKRLFIAKTIQTATAFVKVRHATQQIYRALLSINHLMEMPGKEMRQIREKHGNQIPEMIVGLTRGKYLNNALVRMKEKFNPPAVINLYGALIDQTNPQYEPFLKNPQNPQDPPYPIDWLGLGDEKLPEDEPSKNMSEEIRDRLIERLKTKRARTSDLLRHLDRLYSTLSSEYDFRPKFGITGGPRQPSFSNVMDKIIDQVNTAVSEIAIAAGLGKGRLDDGLETLIERYLNTTEEIPTDHHMVKAERDRLFNSLVRFSKTVLFLANNQILLGNDDSSPLKELAKKSIARDTQVLQAVGNSIVNQIDEIYHRERYEEEIDKRGPREALAMKVAFPRYATDAVDQLITSFEAEGKISDKALLAKDPIAKKLHEDIQTLKVKLEIEKKSSATKLSANTIAVSTLNTLTDHSGMLFEGDGGITNGGIISATGKMTGIIQEPFFQNEHPVAIPKGSIIVGGETNVSKLYGGKLDDLVLHEVNVSRGDIIAGNISGGRITIAAANATPSTLSDTDFLFTDFQTKNPRLEAKGKDLKLSEHLSLTPTGPLTNIKITVKEGNISGFKTGQPPTIKCTETLTGTIYDSIELIGSLKGSCNIQNADKLPKLMENGSLEGAIIETAEFNIHSIQSFGNSMLEFSKDGSHTFQNLKITATKLKASTTSIPNPNPAGIITVVFEDNKNGGKFQTTVKDFNPAGWDLTITSSTTGSTQSFSGTINPASNKSLKGVLTLRSEISSGFPAATAKLDQIDNIHFIEIIDSNLTEIIANNVWLHPASAVKKNRSIIKPESTTLYPVISNTTFERATIEKARLKDIAILKGQLTGTILGGKLTETIKAKGGLISGGILTRGEEFILRDSLIINGKTSNAKIDKTTLTLKKGTYLLKDNLVIKSGVLDTAQNKTEKKLPPGTTVKDDKKVSGITLDGIELKKARLTEAILEEANGTKITTATIKDATFNGVKIVKTDIIDKVDNTKIPPNIPQNAPFKGGSIKEALTSNSTSKLTEGTIEDVSISKITIDSGIVKGGETQDGKSYYADFLVESKKIDAQQQEIKVEFNEFIKNLRTSLKTTIANKNNSPRIEQLMPLEKLLNKITIAKPSDFLGSDKQLSSVWAHALVREFQKKRVQALGNVAITEKEHKNSSGIVKRLEKDKNEKQTALDNLIKEHRTKFKTAKNVLVLKKNSILDHLAKKDRLTSSDMVYSQIIRVLEAEQKSLSEKKPTISSNKGKDEGRGGKNNSTAKKNEKDTSDEGDDGKTALTTTINIVKSRPEPLRVPSPTEIQGLDAKEVMDQLIATLKYEYISAVRVAGQNSALAKQIQDSLKTAYAQRASMVQIRPAFAFLRSSYPSTALQDEASLEWKNMLLSNAHRSLPINSVPWSGDPWPWYQEERLKIQSQIDKQFWHNVNRVRLHGAGDTNYVLMKDDIGNWTVKNYSANPEDIIKSARNLAMYGFGASVGRNLIPQTPLQTTPNQELANNLPANAAQTDPASGNTETQNSSDTQNEDSSLLERQFDKFEKLYHEQTETDLKAVEELVKALSDNIKASWLKSADAKEHADDLSPILEQAKEKHITSIQRTSDASIIEKEKKILSRLGVIKQFHRQAELGILAKQQESGTNDKKKSAYKSALSLMTGHVQKKLLDFIGQRQETVKTFKTQATVLQDSVAQ